MINSLIPTCGYLAPESNTLYPEMNPDYDNTQPRYVTMLSMPSDVITQVLSDASQSTETASFYLSKCSEYNRSDTMGLVISHEELENQKRYKKLYKMEFMPYIFYVVTHSYCWIYSWNRNRIYRKFSQRYD